MGLARRCTPTERFSRTHLPGLHLARDILAHESPAHDACWPDVSVVFLSAMLSMEKPDVAGLRIASWCGDGLASRLCYDHNSRRE